MKNEKITNFGIDLFKSLNELPGVIFQSHYKLIMEVSNSYFSKGYNDENLVHWNGENTVAKFTIKPKQKI